MLQCFTKYDRLVYIYLVGILYNWYDVYRIGIIYTLYMKLIVDKVVKIKLLICERSEKYHSKSLVYMFYAINIISCQND